MSELVLKEQKQKNEKRRREKTSGRSKTSTFSPVGSLDSKYQDVNGRELEKKTKNDMCKTKKIDRKKGKQMVE